MLFVAINTDDMENFFKNIVENDCTISIFECSAG